MGTPAKWITAFLSVLLSGSLCLAAQNPPRTTAGGKASDEPYPEEGFLSASRYISQYFSFSFEIPSDAHLQPMPQPTARDGSIQLLELDGPAPADAQISISAIPTAAAKGDDAKLLMRNALDQELYRGVEELRAVSKANLSGHPFYLFETRRGIEQHVLLASLLGDYILQVVLASHDEKTLRHLESGFDHVTFFPPADLRRYVETDTKPYDGPSISSHRLAMLEADPPAKHIDSGKINGDFYENPQLGFSYRIPEGWVLEPQGAVQPAVERYRTREDFGRPRMGRTEHRLMDACSRILFSAWAKRPDADGQLSYDDFGEVTVSAVPVACFPAMKFPENASDREAFKAFLAQFSLTQPIVDDMGSGKVFMEDGILFLYLHGTVGFQVPDDELSRRLSLAMAITQRRGYILTWFFAAPHDSELQALTNQRAIFDSEPPVKVASAAQPAAGTLAGDPLPHPPAAEAATPSATAPAPAANDAATPETQAAATATSDSSQPEQESPANANRPSLLRPGETMQQQQGKGPLIKPK